jgi:hypothetical protein
MLLLGLNEFNADLLLDVAGKLKKSKYLCRLVGLKKLELSIENSYESGLLEPWVQWVSIHTTVPAVKHKIKNLGDVPNLSHKQIWEVLSDNKKTSIVWGAMNASLGEANNCKIFVPDPWVFSEDPKPNDLQSFIAFPRYLAKNYTSLSKLKIIKLFLSFLKATIAKAGAISFLKGLGIILSGLIKFGPKNHVFINFFDYLTANVFVNSVKKEKPDFAFIFLNSVAHVQHHYWYSSNISNLDEIIFTYKNIERILAIMDKKLSIFSDQKPFLLFNGLAQNSTFEDDAWYLYRVVDLDNFAKTIGIKYKKIESLMTYDAHIQFESEKDMREGNKTLCSVLVGGKRFFYLEEDKQNLKIFFRININNLIEDNSTIRINNTELKFSKYVKRIVKRTGKHTQSSNLFYQNVKLSKNFANSNYNYNFFRIIFPDLFNYSQKK